MKKSSSMIWLKFFATVLITNSHLTKLYPSSMPYLSFGGFFGNLLFFFVSGYLLANSKDSFPKYMVKRIVRIYVPYFLFILVLFSLGHLNGFSLVEIIYPIGLYHFIPIIILLYPFFYFSKLLNTNKFPYLISIIIVIIIQLVFFIFFYDGTYEITRDFAFPCICSFYTSMLLGAYCSQKKHEFKAKYVIAFVIAFLLYALIKKYNLPQSVSILQLYVGLLFTYSLAKTVLSLESDLPNNSFIESTSNLTLEIYLVQFLLIDLYSQLCFPMNIVLCLISIVATSYCLNFISKSLSKKMLDILLHNTSNIK